MRDDATHKRSQAPGRRWRLVVAIGLVGAIGVWILAVAGGSSPDPTPAAVAQDTAAVHPGSTNRSAGVAEPVDPPSLPEGALPPIIGEPRMDRLDYCDERNWRRVDAVVRGVDGDELIVDEVAWREAGASARAGLASWASKCRLDGQRLLVRADGSGHELGAYDPAIGYETFD